MHTYQSLITDLNNLSINPKGTVIVHLSYRNIGDVEGRGHTVIDALMDYMKDGLLVIPTHTWNNVRIDTSPVMDVLKTPVCIGILPEIFRNTENVYRSYHPTHSVAAYGKDAEEFIKGDELAKTPCPENSTWHKLLLRKATILLIGVNYTRNTFIHGIEEWENVKGTISGETHDLYVVAPDGTKYHTPQNRHCAPLGSETFWKVEPLMLKEGAMYEGVFGSAAAKVTDAYKLYKIMSALIARDNQILMTNKPLDASYFEI